VLAIIALFARKRRWLILGLLNGICALALACWIVYKISQYPGLPRQT
jgi:hypothetical protein